MEELNFPVFAKPLPEPRMGSMDEYLEFIKFCMENFYNREADEFWREKRRVNVPFRLKGKDNG